MQISQMVVTPRIAKGWMEVNKVNRKVTEWRVRKYAHDMTRGLWDETGETIQFNGDGSLMNGQHRLLAIILSGKQQRFVIVRGLKSSVFPNIDTGKNRNLSDVLSVAGVKKYQTDLAALTKLWYNYKTIGLDKMFSRYGLRTEVQSRAINNTEFLNFYEVNTNIISSFEFVINLREKSKARTIFPRAMLSFWYSLFEEKDVYKAKEFMQRLINGDNIGQENPIYKFRERALSYKLGGLRLNRKLLTILAIKTWNYWMAGDESKTLRAYENSKMPKII